MDGKLAVALEASDDQLPSYSDDLTQKEKQETLRRWHLRQRQQVKPETGYRGPVRHIWDRILISSSIQFEDNLRIEKQATLMLRNPKYLLRVSKRAEPFIHYILEEIRKRGLPAELALLPVIESAYRPTARSRSRAVGLWQFIPSTSRFLGMKTNWWYDARQDLVVSTKYALDYLSFINKKFDGDWLLTLAAYNAGHGKVSRAIERNRKAGKPTDYWSLRLPKETMDYVPRFLAVTHIFTRANDYQVLLHAVPNQPFFHIISIKDQIDLNVAAEVAGISARDIRHYNAGFLRGVTTPDGPHRLLLPVQHAQYFAIKLAKLPKQKYLRWVKHTVKRGNTLTSIALRYGTSVNSLKRANKLRSPLIRPGEQLLIPLSKRKPTRKLTQRRNRHTPANGKYYTVKSGDTLWSIAKRHKLTLGRLIQLNKLKKNSVLRPGQYLLTDANALKNDDVKELVSRQDD